jgi:acylphosphatase
MAEAAKSLMMGGMAVEVRISGRVQGVSFRWHTRRTAQRLGVTGWVRNEPDGSVLLHAEGDREAVQELVAWCHDGPPVARVADVVTREVPDAGTAGFTVRD